MHVPNQINRLCRKFSARRLQEISETIRIEPDKPESVSNELTTIHQCPHCFTVYDEHYGDVLNNIPAGTAFRDLPATYTCSTCDAPKEEFREIQAEFVG